MGKTTGSCYSKITSEEQGIQGGLQESNLGKKLNSKCKLFKPKKTNFLHSRKKVVMEEVDDACTLSCTKLMLGPGK